MLGNTATGIIHSLILSFYRKKGLLRKDCSYCAHHFKFGIGFDCAEVKKHTPGGNSPYYRWGILPQALVDLISRDVLMT